MYIRKNGHERHVIIEIYSTEFRPELKKRLTDAGFTFTTADIFNNFWGTQFIINAPRGKGTTAKMKFLETVTR